MGAETTADFLATEPLVERDGRWYCAIPECIRSTTPFDDPRKAKSHPWAAHQIRSRNLESVRRRQRRYRADSPDAEIDHTPPPPPLSPVVLRPAALQWRPGPLFADEVETVRRRLLHHVHEIAADYARSWKRGPNDQDAATILDMFHAILIRPKLPPDYRGRQHYRRAAQGRVVLDRVMGRDRWYAEVSRSELIRAVTALCRELKRNRGMVIEAVQQCVIARLRKKEEKLTKLDADRADRLLELLRPASRVS